MSSPVQFSLNPIPVQSIAIQSQKIEEAQCQSESSAINIKSLDPLLEILKENRRILCDAQKIPHAINAFKKSNPNLNPAITDVQLPFFVESYDNIKNFIYNTCLQINPESEVRLKGGMLRHFLLNSTKPLPPDIDLVFFVPNATLQQLIDCSMHFVNTLAYNLSGGNEELFKWFQALLTQTFFIKRGEVSKEGNVFVVFTLMGENAPALEILMASKLTRQSLCCLDSWWIPFTKNGLLGEIHYEAGYQQKQIIEDINHYILRYHDITSVNMKGVSTHYSHLARGARAIEAETSKSLRKNLKNATASEIIKDFKLNVESHHVGGEHGLQTMLLQFITDEMHEPTLNIQPVLQASPNTLFGKICAGNIESNIAAVKVLAFLYVHFPQDKVKIVEHEKKTFLQIKEDDNYWLVPCDSALENPGLFQEFFPLPPLKQMQPIAINGLDTEKLLSKAKTLEPSLLVYFAFYCCAVQPTPESITTLAQLFYTLSNDQQSFLKKNLHKWTHPLLPQPETFMRKFDPSSILSTRKTLPLAFSSQDTPSLKAHARKLWSSLASDEKKEIGLSLIQGESVLNGILVFQEMKSLFSNEEYLQQLMLLVKACRQLQKRQHVIQEIDLLIELLESAQKTTKNLAEENLIWLLKEIEFDVPKLAKLLVSWNEKQILKKEKALTLWLDTIKKLAETNFPLCLILFDKISKCSNSNDVLLIIAEKALHQNHPRSKEFVNQLTSKILSQSEITRLFEILTRYQPYKKTDHIYKHEFLQFLTSTEREALIKRDLPSCNPVEAGQWLTKWGKKNKINPEELNDYATLFLEQNAFSSQLIPLINIEKLTNDQAVKFASFLYENTLHNEPLYLALLPKLTQNESLSLKVCQQLKNPTPETLIQVAALCIEKNPTEVHALLQPHHKKLPLSNQVFPQLIEKLGEIFWLEKLIANKIKLDKNWVEKIVQNNIPPKLAIELMISYQVENRELALKYLNQMPTLPEILPPGLTLSDKISLFFKNPKLLELHSAIIPEKSLHHSYITACLEIISNNDQAKKLLELDYTDLTLTMIDKFCELKLNALSMQLAQNYKSLDIPLLKKLLENDNNPDDEIALIDRLFPENQISLLEMISEINKPKITHHAAQCCFELLKNPEQLDKTRFQSILAKVLTQLVRHSEEHLILAYTLLEKSADVRVVTPFQKDMLDLLIRQNRIELACKLKDLKTTYLACEALLMRLDIFIKDTVLMKKVIDHLFETVLIYQNLAYFTSAIEQINLKHMDDLYIYIISKTIFTQTDNADIKATLIELGCSCLSSLIKTSPPNKPDLILNLIQEMIYVHTPSSVGDSHSRIANTLYRLWMFAKSKLDLSAHRELNMEMTLYLYGQPSTSTSYKELMRIYQKIKKRLLETPCPIRLMRLIAITDTLQNKIIPEEKVAQFTVQEYKDIFQHMLNLEYFDVTLVNEDSTTINLPIYQHMCEGIFGCKIFKNQSHASAAKELFNHYINTMYNLIMKFQGDYQSVQIINTVLKFILGVRNKKPFDDLFFLQAVEKIVDFPVNQAKMFYQLEVPIDELYYILNLTSSQEALDFKMKIITRWLFATEDIKQVSFRYSASLLFWKLLNDPNWKDHYDKKFYSKNGSGETLFNILDKVFVRTQKEQRTTSATFVLLALKLTIEFYRRRPITQNLNRIQYYMHYLITTASFHIKKSILPNLVCDPKEMAKSFIEWFKKQDNQNVDNYIQWLYQNSSCSDQFFIESILLNAQIDEKCFEELYSPTLEMTLFPTKCESEPFHQNTKQLFALSLVMLAQSRKTLKDIFVHEYCKRRTPEQVWTNFKILKQEHITKNEEAVKCMEVTLKNCLCSLSSDGSNQNDASCGKKKVAVTRGNQSPQDKPKPAQFSQIQPPQKNLDSTPQAD